MKLVVVLLAYCLSASQSAYVYRAITGEMVKEFVAAYPQVCSGVNPFLLEFPDVIANYATITTSIERGMYYFKLLRDGYKTILEAKNIAVPTDDQIRPCVQAAGEALGLCEKDYAYRYISGQNVTDFVTAKEECAAVRPFVIPGQTDTMIGVYASSSTTVEQAMTYFKQVRDTYKTIFAANNLTPPSDEDISRCVQEAAKALEIC